MSEDLLLTACLEGAFGRVIESGAGRIAVAGFCYLLGEPDGTLVSLLRRDYADRMFIPVGEGWAEVLLIAYPDIKRLTRRRMRAPAAFDWPRLCAFERSLPAPYALDAINEGDFERGDARLGGYASVSAYLSDGLAFAARLDGKTVSRACAFLRHAGAIELDVTTDEAHRQRGLARALCARLLRACREKGLTAHWDAQNEASARLAETLGYGRGSEYEAYYF